MTTNMSNSMLYDANKKSLIVTYILWAFAGTLGIHRFYAGKIVTGLMQLILGGIGWLLTIILIGYIPLAIVAVWVLIDALLIPGWIRDHNTRLAHSLMQGGQIPR